MKQQEKEEFQEHWPGFVKMETFHWMFGMPEPNIDLPDFAWRTYLSLILKKIPGEEARIKQLNIFFDEYADTIHK